MIDDSAGATLSIVVKDCKSPSDIPIYVQDKCGNDWKYVDGSYISLGNGFQAATYTCGNQAMVVYSGTNQSIDRIDWGTTLLHIIDFQYPAAYSYFLKQAVDLNGYNITITPDTIYTFNADNTCTIQGHDKVLSNISIAIGESGIEDIILLGTDNLNATGGHFDNLLVGNSGNNILDGASGIDTMVGQASRIQAIA